MRRCCCASCSPRCSPADVAARRSDRRPTCASGGRAVATMAVVSRRAARRSAAADGAVRGTLQSTRGAARCGVRGLALSGQPRLPGGRQRHGLAREHQGLLGAELRYAAGRRRHRPLVQLPLRRRRLDHRHALVRRRRRRLAAPRQSADGRRAAGGAALCAGPLHAALFACLQLCAGRQPVPPADRRRVRAGGRACPSRRAAARRLRARGRPARRAMAAGRGHGLRARRRGLGRPVRGQVPSRVVVAVGGAQDRAAGGAGDRSAGPRARAPGADGRGRVRGGHRDRRAHLVQRRLDA